MADGNTPEIGNLNLGDKVEGGRVSSPLAELSTNVKPADAEEFAQKAQELGWAKPTKYDYEAYNNRDTSAPGGVGGFDSTSHQAQTSDLVTWGANAAKYEWNDTYGDVGPKVPELEEILFNDNFTNRKGEHIDALSIEVTVESEAKVPPVKEVRNKFLL